MRTWEEQSLDIENTAEHARVLNQLDRILAYSSFRNSRRYQAFLRYVVEEKLRGNGVLLKERLIGVSVFDQPLDYDTNANSVVRVTAGQVRRRLAEYYLNASAGDEVLIELPLGSYVPEFRLHGTPPGPETTLVVADDAVLYSRAALSPREFVLSPETEPLAVPQFVSQPTSSRKNWWVVGAIAACCLLVAAIVLTVSLIRHSGTEADQIWRGAFDGRDVLICAGPLETPPAQASDPDHHAYTGVSFTTTRTAAIIGSAIGHAGGNAFLLPMQDVKLEDLQRSPAVLIGAFNNQWTMRLQSALRYQLYRSPGNASAGIIDTKNPNDKRFMIDLNVPEQRKRDYGILAHFSSPTTGQSTVVAAGLAMHGTAAVRIFLSSPELLKEFSKSAPRGWERGNYEIVLASDQVNNLADSPKVVAAYYW